MAPPLDLSSLDHAWKDAPIMSPMAQVEALTKRVEELEAKLEDPPKTSGNSSLPPSRGQKASPGAGKSKPKRKPHKGSARALHPDPARTVTQRADVCPHRAAGGAAVVIETTSAPAATETIYLLKDHPGSTDVITDAAGQVQTRYSFDASRSA